MRAINYSSVIEENKRTSEQIKRHENIKKETKKIKKLPSQTYAFFPVSFCVHELLFCT